MAQGLKPYRPLLALLLLVAAACGGLQAPGEDPPAPPTGLSIHFQTRPLEGQVRVSYLIAAGDEELPTRLRFSFPHHWAGHTDLGDDIERIRFSSDAWAPITARPDDEGNVQINRGDARWIRMDYDLTPSRRLLSATSRFRGLFSSTRFFAPGLALLAVPLNLPASMTRSIQVESACEEPRWCMRSTLDLAQPQSLGMLTDAAFFAGAFDVVERARSGSTITLYTERGVTTGGHALGDRLLRVVEAQAHLLTPADAAHTTALVLLRADDPNALNGAGRAGGFVLELGSAADAQSESLVELLAHENFHRLNGHHLVYATTDEFQTMWFREGVTDYVALRNATASRLLPNAAFFRWLGRTLANYHGNPRRDVITSSVGNTFWLDRDLRRLPYDRGALLGLLIDLRLRTAGRSLDDFFLALRESNEGERRLVSNARLLAELERYSEESWSEFWENFVHGAHPLPIFETLQRIGLRVVERVEPAPWFGLRVSVSTGGDWYVSGVEADSPAALAGLRTGLALAGEPYIPEQRLDESAVLEVVQGSARQRITLPPARGQRRTYALLADDDLYLGAFGLLSDTLP